MALEFIRFSKIHFGSLYGFCPWNVFYVFVFCLVKFVGLEMLMVDLFSGLNGASQYAREIGWDVLSVDNNPEFNPDLCIDIKDLHWMDLPKTIDLLWSSPPCDDFSRESMPWCQTGKTPDIDLFIASIKLARIIKPKYWIIENVRGAQRYFGRASCHLGPFYFWGWFPKIKSINKFYFKEKLFPSLDRKVKRAKIPYEVSKIIIEKINRKKPVG